MKDMFKMVNEFDGFYKCSDSGLNFDVLVSLKDPMWGGNYRVTGMDFEINKL